MNSNIKFLAVAAALTTVGIASAQSSTTIDRPWKVELGAHFPTTKVSGADEKVGGTVALGYRFLRLESGIDLEAELRGTSYKLDFGATDTDVSLSELLLNGYYHLKDNPLFFNLGLGAGTGEIKRGNTVLQNDDTRFLYQVGVGYQFQPNLYGVARYHGGSEDGFRGWSIAAGYRF